MAVVDPVIVMDPMAALAPRGFHKACGYCDPCGKVALMKFVTVVVFHGRRGVCSRRDARGCRDACGISLCRWPRVIGLVRTV